MKTMLGLLAVGVVLFGLSAAGSLWLQSKNPTEESKDDKAAKKSAPLTAPTAIVEARHPANPTPENVVQLAANLRKQQESLKAREQKLLVRQKHLEVIGQDILNERKHLDELRGQINEELKALIEKMDALEKKAGGLEKERKKIADQAKDIKLTMFEVEDTESARIKQMASMYDAMEADVAAEILQQMADSGKIETAVKILAAMKERQAARVLAQFPDRTTVVQLLEKMKGLKKKSAS